MEFIQDPFGLKTDTMDALQMCLRAVTVFVAALMLLRIAGTRTMGKQSAFDHLTLLIVGAILGRIIVTGKNFFGALAAVLLIVITHRMLALITYRNKFLGKLVKGQSLQLVSEGIPEEKNLSEANITKEDLIESLRNKLNTEDLTKVQKSYMERSGEITFVRDK